MTLQPAGVIPPDVELWGTGYLRAFLATRPEVYAANVYVSNTKPTTDRPRTVVVRRDGGPVRGVFDLPRIAVRVWADKEQEAADLARLIVAGLKVAALGSSTVVAVTSVFGPSPIPEAGQFQRLINAELQMRCAVL